MPRHQYKKRTIQSDPIYNSYEVAKFINYVMVDGKRTVGERIVYTVLENLKAGKKDPIITLNKAIANVSPNKEVKPRRLGGASYLVPIDVRNERKLYLALNWIIDAAKARSNKEFHSFADKLTAEIKEAAKNQGKAAEKKAQTEKTAAANKAFAHLQW
ncbi:30S ribosomal protein S7 [Candidatus Woesebacteria bacterium]|nr:30S ribosomal protein S7 [Candidatus Woesebacteria bacterium]